MKKELEQNSISLVPAFLIPTSGVKKSKALQQLLKSLAHPTFILPDRFKYYAFCFSTYVTKS